jgi:hypothetical protein
VAFQRYNGKKGAEFGWNGKIHRSRVFVAHFPIRGYNSERIKDFKRIKMYLLKVKK